jgi:hypothetical protein
MLAKLAGEVIKGLAAAAWWEKTGGVEARWNTTGASPNRAVLATRCYE